MFMYKAGLVDHLRDNRTNHTLPVDVNDIQSLPNPKHAPMDNNIKPQSHQAPEGKDGERTGGEKDSMNVNHHHQGDQPVGWGTKPEMDNLLWRKLPKWHWPGLFHCYNISLRGR